MVFSDKSEVLFDKYLKRVFCISLMYQHEMSWGRKLGIHFQNVETIFLFRYFIFYPPFKMILRFIYF